MLGTVFLRDLRARVRVKSYEKYVYLGFPTEFEGRRGTIRRPYAPSRIPYRSHGHPRNFDMFDLWGPWGWGGHLHLHHPHIFIARSIVLCLFVHVLYTPPEPYTSLTPCTGVLPYQYPISTRVQN